MSTDFNSGCAEPVDEFADNPWQKHDREAAAAGVGRIVRAMPGFIRIAVRLAWRCSKGATIGVVGMQLTAAVVSVFGLLGVANHGHQTQVAANGLLARSAMMVNMLYGQSLYVHDFGRFCRDAEAADLRRAHRAAGRPGRGVGLRLSPWVAAGRTVVLITHRLAGVRLADQIVVLHKGSLIEHGTHDELMRAGGHYADLYALQAQAYEPFPPAWITEESAHKCVNGE